MSRLLSRVGRTATDRPRLVLLVWGLLTAAVVAGAALLGPSFSEELTVPGTESSVAQEVLEEEFPDASGAGLQAVVELPDGTTAADPQMQAAVTASTAAVAEVDQVAAVGQPVPSDDGDVLLLQVPLDVPREEVADTTVADVDAALDPLRDAGLEVSVGGSAVSEGVESSHAAEIAGVALALLVLLVTFGSVVAAGLPLLTAAVGLAGTLGGITVASHVLDVSTTAETLAVMIGLAVGIDYALFVVSRHRQQLAAGDDVRTAARRATATAGTAVVVAGATVVIALLGLAVVGIPFLAVMGAAAALAVVLAVLSSVVALPAVLVLVGERLRPRERSGRRPGRGRTAAGERWARWVTRRPARVLLTGAAALGVLAVPVTGMQLALPDNGSAAAGSDARTTFDVVADAYGPGANGPLLVVADVSGSADPTAAAAAVATAAGELDGVERVSPPQLSADADTALVQVVPTTAPSDAGTADLVHDLRALSDELVATSGAEISVTGVTATGVDVSQSLSDALLPYLLLVVGLSFLLLVVVFRSVAVPLVAAAGFLLSVGAALGVTVAVAQWGWLADVAGLAATGPLVSFLPVMLLAVLFGLAMDYQVFLVSRVREAWAHGADPVAAVHAGGRDASRVVVAAGLIMVGVFAAFVRSGSSSVAPIALALAAGVLVDAFVVRLTLVPATLALLGRRAWWLPAWLDRRLPHVDVEGTSSDDDHDPAHEDHDEREAVEASWAGAR